MPSPLASCEMEVGSEVVGDGGVRGVVGEGDGGDVHGVPGVGGDGDAHVGEGGGVAVHAVAAVDGETAVEAVCMGHDVQNGVQVDNVVQAGNVRCVKSRHLGRHGIARQDKQNMCLSKPVGCMVMKKP